jgi:hypothetical protein
MNLQEFRQLQAERSALDRLLASLPPERAIERLGLEARLREVEEALASQQPPQREPLRTKLTFRGKPIVGSHGMFAEFGAEVVAAFSEAVAAIGAGLGGPLGSRGVLPSRDAFRLLITGTAPGSFGFQFEEAPADSQMLFPPNSTLESAIAKAQAIMQASLGTDDELTEALSETEPRALDSMRKFLDTLATSEAVCTMEFKGEVFRFADVEQVRRSVSRLARDNIHECEEAKSGSFLGVLPHRRAFEFRLEGTDEIIGGKVGKDVTDPGAINRILERPVRMRVHSRCVGEGRPRFVLLGYEEVGASQSRGIDSGGDDV